MKHLPGNIPGILYVVNLQNELITAKNFVDNQMLSHHLLAYTAVRRTIVSGKAQTIEGEQHDFTDLNSFVSYSIPLFDYSKFVGGLGLIVPVDKANSFFMDFLGTLTIAITLGYQSFHSEVQNLRLNKGMSEEVQRRDMLFNIASKFHSTMNAEQVVYNVIDTIQELYPDIMVDLYLSLDIETSNPSYYVKSLNMDATDDLTLLAFRDGVSKISRCNGHFCIASPIRGNQGVYGVLRMEKSDDQGFNLREQEFIQFITDAGGSAFENAQLYEQSRHLIQELRMINEMAKQMNRSLRLNDVLEYILKQIKEAFHSDYCLILTFDQQQKKYRVISSNDPEYVGYEFHSEMGPLGKLYRNKESYIVLDTQTRSESIHDDPLNTFAHRSLLLVPFIQNGELTGAIAVLDKRQGYFNYENLKLLQLIAQHTSLAITNASLHLEMERLIITDTLTGLNTRKHLNEKTRESMAHHERGSMILIDIDHFKKVNDRYGHLVGDEILVQVAAVLKDCIRSDDVASRWGGEELAVYLPKVTHEVALQIAERIRLYVHEQTNPQITVSIGVSTWEQEESNSTPQKLFLEADKALYQAKNNGRDQVVSSRIE